MKDKTKTIFKAVVILIALLFLLVWALYYGIERGSFSKDGGRDAQHNVPGQHYDTTDTLKNTGR